MSLRAERGKKEQKGERGERENLRKSPWGRSHLLGIALPPCTSSHPSFKTERFFICSRVTSERDVTSVHDSRFLKKKERKMGRDERKLCFMTIMRTRRVDAWGMLRVNENERLDDRKWWESVHFLNTMPLWVCFSLREFDASACAQPRVLPSRGEWVFLSKGRTFESYSQKVKLPRVNVKKKREMEGKGRGTESRDIIEA